jgi:hypothetical protein
VVFQQCIHDAAWKAILPFLFFFFFELAVNLHDSCGKNIEPLCIFQKEYELIDPHFSTLELK